MSRLTRCFYCAVSVALFIFIVPSNMDAQATSRILQAKWEFHAVSNTDNAQLKEWHPAEVPGV
ncbi:MAG: hypothetical protein WBQ83_08135, partial [Candidatus Acidiferrales bacterium]